MVHFACVCVADPHDRLLLQERDEHAPVAPGQWSLPGGALEPGESPRHAAARELAEETELVVPAGDLADLGRFHVDLGGPLEFALFAVRADVGNDDVTCHEGRQMVFVDRDALDTVPIADATRMVLPVLDAWLERTREPTLLSGVILVDRRGWILLQERDEHPALDPDCWGLAGGHLDPGEDFEPGAYRELAEETGVELPPGTLTMWREYAVHGGRMQVFVGACDLTDADIDCREGRQIVFVDPATTSGLEFGSSAGIVVPEFLASRTYAALAGGRR